MGHPVLWHFTFSHFGEKVRWALDFKGVPHERRALLPGLHYPRVLWLSGQPTTPVLELDGRRIADSTRIIAALEARWPEPPLYPRDEAERRRALALEDFFDEELGHHLRRFMLQRGFAAPEGADYGAAFFTAGFGRGARLLFRLAAPVMFAFLRRRFDVSPASAAVSQGKILAALDRIESEVGAAGYLTGDRFSVADLAAAALLSPLVRPPQFPYALPPSTDASFREALAGRPALRWVLETYRRHRGASAEIAA